MVVLGNKVLEVEGIFICFKVSAAKFADGLKIDYEATR